MCEFAFVKGSEQFPRFNNCPICGTDIHIIGFEDQNYFVICPNCNVSYGLPYGYSSRVDLANDWNELHLFKI